MKKFSIILVVVICHLYFCSSINAQNNNSYVIQGNIYDAFSQKGLDSVTVILLNTDSIVMAQTLSHFDNNTHGRYYLKNLSPGKYLLKYKAEGFREEYSNITIRKGANILFRAKNIMLHRSIPAIPKNVQLSETVIKASLIKMVYDKDTLIYNAAAFKLAEGSMLDELIKQLPGTTFKDGKIFVNGELVHTLLVNGKDFFKGDPSIALENLPAYMVNKIKVYRRENEISVIPNRETPKDEKELVMDVKLKKEYNTGWISNVQTALGTSNHYLSRIFGLLFTNKTRFSVYGNINNINDNKNPTENSDWSRDIIYEGVSSRKKAGFMWGYDNTKQNIKINIEGHTQHKDIDNKSLESTVKFMQPDVWLRSKNTGKICSDNVSIFGEVTWRPDFWNNVSFFKFTPKIEFYRNTNKLEYYNIMLNQEPNEHYRGEIIDSIFIYGGSSKLNETIINQVKRQTLSDNDNFKTSGYWYASPGFPISDFFIKWDGNYSYEYNDINNFSIYNLNYPNQENENIYHHNFIDSNRKKYFYDVNTYLQYFKKTFIGKIIYTYSQEYTNSNRERFLLENLSDWSQDLEKPINLLPSTKEHLLSCLDKNNSYYSTLKNYTHKINFCAEYSWNSVSNKRQTKNHRLKLQIPIRIQNEHLTYKRNELYIKDKKRNRVFLEPEFEFNTNNFKIYYSLKHTAPDMIYLLPIRDDTDPININVGNEKLSDIHNHHILVRKEWGNRNKNTNSSYTFDWKLTNNAVAMSRMFNTENGVTTFMPENVNGNWNASSEFRTTMPLDKKNNWFLNNTTNIKYYNSVDLLDINNQTNTRRSVQNFSTTEELHILYKFKKCSFGGKFGIRWTNAHSSSKNFNTINCQNWLLGCNTTIPLIWKISLSTDFSTTIRSGYNDSNMNEAAFMCNLRLSRSFLKGKLTMILDAFDLLNGTKDIRYTINEQGQTERWFNTTNRYVMIHAFYKFAKKKKQ